MESHVQGEPPLHFFRTLVEVVDVFVQHLPELHQKISGILYFFNWSLTRCSGLWRVRDLSSPLVGVQQIHHRIVAKDFSYVFIRLLLLVPFLWLLFQGQLPVQQLLRPQDGEQNVLARDFAALHDFSADCGLIRFG